MSGGEGHRCIAKVKASVECGQEANEEHGHEADVGYHQGTNAEPNPEANIGPALQIE